MTLAQIMQMALRQMDEGEADISEYDDVFRRYANEGYQLAMRDAAKPRQTLTLKTDKDGYADTQGMGAARIAAAYDAEGNEVFVCPSPDGRGIRTDAAKKTLTVIAEMEPGMLLEDMDVPELPEWAHGALADYICYRHLSGGGLTKQKQAQFFYSMYSQTMRRIRPQGMGSVTGYRNLYEATDVRRRG